MFWPLSITKWVINTGILSTTTLKPASGVDVVADLCRLQSVSIFIDESTPTGVPFSLGSFLYINVSVSVTQWKQPTSKMPPHFISISLFSITSSSQSDEPSECVWERERESESARNRFPSTAVFPSDNIPLGAAMCSSLFHLSSSITVIYSQPWSPHPFPPLCRNPSFTLCLPL